VGSFIISIVTRRLYLSLLLGLFFSPGLFPQQQNQPQPQQNPPEEDQQNPPEEDESVAPEKFVLNPLESERNVRVGNFYMHKGTTSGYRAALARYERAAKFNPSNAEAYFRMGEAEEKLKNKDKAKIAFQRVIDIAPDSKLAHEAKKKLAKI
jgi:tetratricopeptide (TPR) repeat protein